MIDGGARRLQTVKAHEEQLAEQDQRLAILYDQLRHMEITNDMDRVGAGLSHEFDLLARWAWTSTGLPWNAISINRLLFE